MIISRSLICLAGMLCIGELQASIDHPIAEQGISRDSTNLVNMSTFDPRIKLDIRYANKENFLSMPVYSTAACYLHRDAAIALKEVQDELEQVGLGLKIFDGYRPLPVQQVMWDLIQDDRYVSNPAVNKGRHTRGTAIDLTLIDQEGNELLMPTPFDDFTDHAHADYIDLPAEAIRNRALLRKVMETHHFIQYEYEWWHYDYQGWNDDEKYPPLEITFEEIDICSSPENCS